MSARPDFSSLLERIALALERVNPPALKAENFENAEGFVWEPSQNGFSPVAHINRVPLELLQGIDGQKQLLLDNSRQFAKGYAANNALLWGARGMGKSSLVKAAHGQIINEGLPLKLVEIHREDISSLPRCLAIIGASRHRFIVYCDDLSFDTDDKSYKSLKAVLEGGIEGRPQNVLFYATSNRRHLMPRDMIENERSTAINPAEAVEEKISLSDRFGLWIGFHNCSQNDFFNMIKAYARHFHLEASDEELQAGALEWSMIRGARSGRVAWQFVQDLAGRQQKQLEI